MMEGRRMDTAVGFSDLEERNLDCGNALSPKTAISHPVPICCTENYISTANCHYGRVYIHGNSGANLRKEFSLHEGRVQDMAHLFGDVLVSVDRLGCVFVWDAGSLHTLGDYKVPFSKRLLYVAKLATRNAFIVGSTTQNSGNVAVRFHFFTYNNTATNPNAPLNLQRTELKLKRGGVVVGAYDTTLIVKTTVKALKYNLENAPCLNQQYKNFCFSSVDSPSGYYYEFFGDVDVSYFIFSYENKRMIIHANDAICTHLATIHIDYFTMGDVPHDSLRAVTIISPNLLMVTTEKFGVYFLDVQGNVVAKIDVSKKSQDLRNCCVTADARICVAGADAYCGIWNCPPEVSTKVKEYALNSIKKCGISNYIEKSEDVRLRAVENSNGNISLQEEEEEYQNVSAYDAENCDVPHAAGNTAGNERIENHAHTGKADTSPLELLFNSWNSKLEAAEKRHKEELAVERRRLEEAKGRHATEIETLKNKLADDESKHEAETWRLKKRIEDLSEAAHGNGNGNSNKSVENENEGELEKWRAKYERAAAEKDGKERQVAELKAGLEAERTRGRRYKTETGIKTINLKAQLEIQKMKMDEYEEDLRAEKTKREEAESELKRILTLFKAGNGGDDDDDENDSNENAVLKKRRKLS